MAITSITTTTGLTGGGAGPIVTIGLAPSSTIQFGGVTLATDPECVAGTNTTKVVTPSGLTARLATLPPATTSSLGLVVVGSGLYVGPTGVVSTVNNGTVTSITAGVGLGAPVTGNTITSTGTIRLLAPTVTDIGGVKAGTNINIAVDGTITPTGLLQTNNPYSYNAYIWPVPDPFGFAPGVNGQILTLLDKVTGEVGWTDTGTITTVTGGTGISVVSTATTATISLAPVATAIPATYGATCLIPTFTINSAGQITSAGQANAYPPFQTATVAVPTSLVLDFTDNNTNWEWTLQGNTAIQAPLNCQSGQTGALVLTQGTSVYSVTWHTNWKWANSLPFAGNPLAGGVDMILFTVVSPTNIVVTSVVNNVG